VKVPFFDLSRQHGALVRELEAAVRPVLESGAFILGPDVAAFEKEYATFCGCRHAVGVACGLDGIKLVLRALDIGPGDEVITAANTFVATAFAISSVGATPVLVDVDPGTFNLDPSKVADAITPRSRALMPVHLYGQPAEMDALLALAREKRLQLIEDASQAHGARYRGARAGALGSAGVFSFYPAKNIGAFGDGGITTTNDEAIARKIATLRNYGSIVKYHHDLLGENSRLDTVHAAILRTKLKHLDSWNAARRRLAARYGKLLDAVGDLILPAPPPHVEHVYHQYVVRTRKRDALQKFLAEREIGTMVHYPVPIHLQKAYAGQNWAKGQFPITEQLAGEILSLPMFPELTDQEQDCVADAVTRFFAR